MQPTFYTKQRSFSSKFYFIQLTLKPLNQKFRLLASQDGQTATSIEWQAIEEALADKLTGSYFLRTSLIHLDAKDLWQPYNTLRGVEDVFRFMKSSLGLRPVYHQLERQVDGHLWITIMAYHLIQQCLYQIKQRGIQYEWKTVRKVMRFG